MSYKITDDCTACGTCIDECPVDAIKEGEIYSIDADVCTDCGSCADVCPVEAMVLVSANDPHHPNGKKAQLIEDRCLGCAVCLRACSTKSIVLKPRVKRVLTPLNGVHKAVVMAIERGKLQHLIFDNHVLFSHRAMAAVLGVMLKLPPIKQIMASEQIKSRYFEQLIQRMKTV